MILAIVYFLLIILTAATVAGFIYFIKIIIKMFQNNFNSKNYEQQF